MTLFALCVGAIAFALDRLGLGTVAVIIATAAVTRFVDEYRGALSADEATREARARDLDDTRRLLFAVNLAGMVAEEHRVLGATIINALVHHSLKLDVAEAATHIPTALNGGAGPSTAWSSNVSSRSPPSSPLSLEECRRDAPSYHRNVPAPSCEAAAAGRVVGAGASSSSSER